ncbi:MAG TPA: TonB-dependent receptor [Gammaproteobacteria bacterium]|nr:TonB-dependent receptor [Gammaproteobacteria bacterium]
MKLNFAPSAGRLVVKPLAAAVATLIGGGLSVAPALSQEPGAVRQVDIEELVVTASRRETTVQELPFNIAAVTGETLDRQRLTSLVEFSRWVPGLSVIEQGGRTPSLMTVRGLNVRSIDDGQFLGNGGGDTVATYLGEIPLYVDFKMKDLDRVEVLLGPQGTLYGEGTLGGAVRYIPHAPDTENLTFDLHGDLSSLSQADDKSYQADAVVNVPFGDGRLAFRGAVAYLDDSGFIDYPYLLRQPGVSNPQPNFNNPAEVAANLYRQNDVDWEQTLSGRLALLWRITDSVDATFNYYFQDQENGGRTINQRQAFNTGRYESGQRFLEPNDRENQLLSVELVADLGFATLTSATGFSNYDQVGQRDQTDLLLDFGFGYELFPSFAAYTRETSTEDRTNEELRLVSNGTGRLSWIAGLFYNKLETKDSSSEFTPGYPEFFFGDPNALPTGDLEFRQTRHLELDERALFGELGYRFTDRWQATIGGRWFNYDFSQIGNVLLPYVPESDDSVSAVDDHGFLAKLNTSYRFNDAVMGYVTISEGYRVGGANGAPPCILPVNLSVQAACALPNEIPIDPDTTTNYEVGVHSTWNGGKLLFNGALYHIDWQHIQTESTTVNGALRIIVNGGKAKSNGVELAFQSHGLEHWSFTSTYAYNEAELTTFAQGLVGGVDALPGDRLSGTPQNQASFYVNYYRRLASGWDLDAGYGLTSSSDVWTKVGLRDNGEVLGGYTVHNVSASLSKDRWSATVYVDNLTDKFAETAVRLDPSFIRNVNGFDLRRYFRNDLRPRNLGVEFRYRVGNK